MPHAYTDFLVFDFDSNPQSTTLWVSKLNITPLMWLWRNFQLLVRETNSGLKFEIFIQIIKHFFFSENLVIFFFRFLRPVYNFVRYKYFETIDFYFDKKGQANEINNLSFKRWGAMIGQ